MKWKICGMKYSENTHAISALQPHYLGFVFWDQSKRYCEAVIDNLPKDIQKVGVFVNAPMKEIEEKIALHQLDLVQLHGNETPEFCLELRQKNHKVIKAIGVSNDFNFNTLNQYKNTIDYFLFDTKGKLPGGNGTLFNWEILDHYHEAIPYFLSGGIGPNDVPQLKKFFQSNAAKYCFAIDLNSQFEEEPGRKNKEKIGEFKNQIKQWL